MNAKPETPANDRPRLGQPVLVNGHGLGEVVGYLPPRIVVNMYDHKPGMHQVIAPACDVIATQF